MDTIQYNETKFSSFGKIRYLRRQKMSKNRKRIQREGIVAIKIGGRLERVNIHGDKIVAKPNNRIGVMFIILRFNAAFITYNVVTILSVTRALCK